METPKPPAQLVGTNDFVVVANRLPVDQSVSPEGAITWSPSPGGLVTALSPVLEKHRGCWVGWPGTTEQAPEPFRTDSGVLLHPVTLTAEDFENFYEGFSNATLWPLYHDLIVPPQYHRQWWEAYREVNEKFARETASVAAEGATVWVQDYQLQLVPGILRQIRPDLTIGFFLHIPFPAPDLFRQLPWREEIVRGVLGSDVIGFHLESNARNFIHVVEHVSGLEVAGQVGVRQAGAKVQASDGRWVHVGAFPISIDPTPFLNQQVDVAKIRAELGNPRVLILGVDRLDYTKGILQRLHAIEEMHELGALEPDTLFLQIATPSRERIDHYQATRAEVEQAVGRINGRFGQIGRPVVSYHHTSLPKWRLVELYSAADVMLVTPFKDGMNLVAKEYVACHGDGSGALVLSEFAGAAEELAQAYLCNPFDVESIKRQLQHSTKALAQDPDSARARMRQLHTQVVDHDVNVWANAFLHALKDSENM
ncbi:trehalose-6-phosphate synthase [Corynebacterium felinum]|uniref:alpha,alpha-trehalose-phosphate synthase (ADP-forming) n=1 Tax=Corynebacterium felinum TaxID=131318 RepID=A0ABU2B585_9CORY|nr:trehalose-6-phosphate synthase [Corynebacterium felinum]MDF5821222.1 trehalose-6-phosphate synthase [Corynebacterium felinum]MDR7353777.1 trehalose 6-phosphate synthase [Corynebacterium felinum]WJY95956.1 Trehalose-phosphate synthase [Corynebacterium felinum]